MLRIRSSSLPKLSTIWGSLMHTYTEQIYLNNQNHRKRPVGIVIITVTANAIAQTTIITVRTIIRTMLFKIDTWYSPVPVIIGPQVTFQDSRAHSTVATRPWVGLGLIGVPYDIL